MLQNALNYNFTAEFWRIETHVFGFPSLVIFPRWFTNNNEEMKIFRHLLRSKLMSWSWLGESCVQEDRVNIVWRWETRGRWDPVRGVALSRRGESRGNMMPWCLPRDGWGLITITSVGALQICSHCCSNLQRSQDRKLELEDKSLVFGLQLPWCLVAILDN